MRSTPPSESLWDVTPPNQTWPPLDQEIECDVLIVGAGITGITAALRLAEAGKNVAIVEAHRVGSGTTWGSSAHLTEEIDARYASVIEKFGIDEARLVAAASRASIEHVQRRVDQFAIDCDFERVPGYLYAEERDHLSDLEREHAAAREAGLDALMETSIPLPFEVAGGIRFRHQARFNVLAYVRALADICARMGVRIYEQTHVTKIDDGEPCSVHLESGVVVRATEVFCATHGPLNSVLLSTKLPQYRSYVVAFPDVPLTNALFWDTMDPYHYLRTATVNGHRYVLVGGEDHKTGTEEEAHHIQNLVDYARTRLRAGKPSHTWSAQLLEPLDGLPYIGRESRHRYLCTGLSGNGLTLGTAGALLVADLILGIENPLEHVFSVSRIKPLATLLPFVRENASFPAHLIGDRLGARHIESIDEVPAGEGRTLKLGGRRLAVYRDDLGGIHAVSAVCTHMGCLVKFNDVERTWDCPCHGSRFSTDGDVLDGPATRRLEKVQIEEQLPLKKAK